MVTSVSGFLLVIVQKLSDFRDRINAIETQQEATKVPAGGLPGQMLVKNSAADNDVSWETVTRTLISETEPEAPTPFVWYKVDAQGNILDILIVT